MSTQKQSLLTRLDASDNELCKEAAQLIREMIKNHNEDMLQAERDARDAYTEGEYAGREESRENGDW